MLLKFKCLSFFQFFILTTVGLLNSCKPDPFFENKIIGEVNFLSTPSDNNLTEVNITLQCQDKKTQIALYTQLFKLTQTNNTFPLPQEEHYNNINCTLEIDSFIFKKETYTPDIQDKKTTISITPNNKSSNTHVYKNESKKDSVHFNVNAKYNHSDKKFDINFKILKNVKEKLNITRDLSINFSKKHKDNKYYYIITLKNNSKEADLKMREITLLNVDVVSPKDSSVSDFFDNSAKKQCYNNKSTDDFTTTITYENNKNNKYNDPISCVLILSSDTDKEFKVPISFDKRPSVNLKYEPSSGIKFKE